MKFNLVKEQLILDLFQIYIFEFEKNIQSLYHHPGYALVGIDYFWNEFGKLLNKKGNINKF